MNAQIVKKIGMVSAVLIAVVLFFMFDLQQYLTLEYIKSSQAQFQELYARNTMMVISGYFCIYILVVALNLPGAAVMSLAGGALFGFWIGFIVVSFASSIGATIACVVARYLFRDFVQNKFGDRLIKVNEGIEREGAFYLFTMRLIPAIPFFAINLIMGLTKMRLWTFYWVSQVGMLAGTVVFINAGKELGKIDSLAGILSPSLIVSFIILGVFPIAVKKVMQFVRKKAVISESVSE